MRRFFPSMVKRGVLASLLLAASAVGAQPATKIDEKCPLQDMTGEGSTLKMASGRSAVLSAKDAKPHECKPGGCDIEVEAQTFARANGEDACCIRIQYKYVVVPKRATQRRLRFNINSVDAKDYVFVTPPIRIIPPPNATIDDFDEIDVKQKGKQARIRSINVNKLDFNYGLNVIRRDGSGKTLACDLNDPIIVNQGN